MLSAGNTNNKKSEGSSYALQFSDDKYVKNNYQIGVATEYEDYAFNSTGEAKSLPKGTILGHFSGIPIEFTAIAQPVIRLIRILGLQLKLLHIIS